MGPDKQEGSRQVTLRPHREERPCTIGRTWRKLLVMTLLDRFAGTVRRLRAKKGVSQKALADTIGISVSYVSMLERGQRSPPLETIEKVARALKVPPAALLGGR